MLKIDMHAHILPEPDLNLKYNIPYAGSYPPGSVGIIRAAHEVGLKPKLFGGGMVGLQYAVFLSKLGPMLNGIVNYDFWVPEPTLRFPGIEAFLKKYQARAAEVGVDPLGHYLPPWSYAYLEVLGQAIEATKSTDQQKVGEYIRAHTFNTIVGKVKFGANGEWATTRTLMVQFQNIKGSSVDQFSQPGKRVVLYRDLGHLHQRERSFLHARAPGARNDDQCQAVP